MILTSRQNPLCKLVRSLHTAKGRRENGVFLVEGKNGVEAALEAAWPIRKILCAPEAIISWQVKNLTLSVQPVAPAILQYLSDAETSPGVLALAALPEAESTLPDDLLLVLDGVSDPGNVGTLVRSSDAAGAGGVLAISSSADPFAPKAVRASSGSLFHLPLLKIEDDSPRAVIKALQAASTPIIVADAGGEISCFDFEWPRRCALILGHETRGVSKWFHDAASAKIKIPIYGKAESLNVASAGTVLLYAWRNGINREGHKEREDFQLVNE
jgi:TrmH family RNA methyltransferase